MANTKKQIRKAKREARKRQERHDRRVFCAMLQDRGLPCPDVEHVFHPTRKWRLDYAWVEHKVGLEKHGAVWTQGRHTRGKGFINDREKMNEAHLHGWIVIEVATDDFMTDDTLDMIERAINLQQRRN